MASGPPLDSLELLLGSVWTLFRLPSESPETMWHVLNTFPVKANHKLNIFHVVRNACHFKACEKPWMLVNLLPGILFVTSRESVVDSTWKNSPIGLQLASHVWPPAGSALAGGRKVRRRVRESITANKGITKTCLSPHLFQSMTCRNFGALARIDPPIFVQQGPV